MEPVNEKVHVKLSADRGCDFGKLDKCMLRGVVRQEEGKGNGGWTEEILRQTYGPLPDGTRLVGRVRGEGTIRAQESGENRARSRDILGRPCEAWCTRILS